jgi:MFS transporter, DHA3 family, macrolide efflux protein
MTIIRPVFYTILVTQVVSLVGSRMTAVALGIWVFTETQAATPLLLASFFAELPGMLGGSLAGVLVDRWDRRWTIVLSDAGQAAGTLFLLWSFVSGQFQLWHLYLVSFLQGVFGTLQDPAQNAVVTLLVPETQRERANGIREMVFPFAGILAPVLGGLLYVWTGVTGVILVDLATFLIAVTVVSMIRLPRPRVSEEGLFGRGTLFGELAGAMRFLRARPALLYYLLYAGFICFMLNGPLELTIPYLLLISGDERLLGAVLGIMSLGAFSGGLLISLVGKVRSRMTVILAGMLLCGVMFLLYGVFRNAWAIGIVLFILLLPLPIWGALEKSMLQVKVPGDLQGRVFALYGQLALLASTLSFLLTGYLADHVLEPAVAAPGWETVAWLVGNSPGSGIGLLQVVTGLLILAATLWVWFWPRVRHLEDSLPDYSNQESSY